VVQAEFTRCIRKLAVDRHDLIWLACSFTATMQAKGAGAAQAKGEQSKEQAKGEQSKGSKSEQKSESKTNAASPEAQQKQTSSARNIPSDLKPSNSSRRSSVATGSPPLQREAPKVAPRKRAGSF
jgi:hypothetical protein